MRKKVDVSIIIPVYNTDQFLEECLQSVKKQTFQNYEVICIDDGSTDRCKSILSRFENEPKFRVVYQCNHGVSYTRNIGLDLAIGKYVFFLDSDDIIPENCLSRLICHAASDYGMVCAGYAETSEKNNYVIQTYSMKDVDVSALEAMNLHGQSVSPADYLFPKLYDRKIIHDCKLRFAIDIKIKEDSLFSLQFLDKCVDLGKKVRLIDDILYYYRRDNSTSATNRARNDLQLSLNNIHSSNVIFEEFGSKYDGERFIDTVLAVKLKLILDFYIKAYCLREQKAFSPELRTELRGVIKKLKKTLTVKEKIKSYMCLLSPGFFSWVVLQARSFH